MSILQVPQFKGIPASGSIANAALANSSLTVTAGTGLTGGGSVSLGGSVTVSLPNVGPGAGSIGGSGSAIQSITLDAQGRVTAATTVSDVATGTFTNTRLTVGTGTNTLGDSGLTWSSPNLDVASGSFQIGTAVATALTIGRSAITTTIDSSIVLGNSSASTVTYTGRVAGNILFVDSATHTLQVAGTGGGDINVLGGIGASGAAGSGAAGGDAGGGTIRGGVGGNGGSGGAGQVGGTGGAGGILRNALSAAQGGAGGAGGAGANGGVGGIGTALLYGANQGTGGTGGAGGTGATNGGTGGAGPLSFYRAVNGGTGGQAGTTGGIGGTGGAGGPATYGAGNGGPGGAAGGGTQGNGGAGGASSYLSGFGGSGLTGGQAGDTTLTTGNAGSGGNVNGASIFIDVGTATGTGTVGNINIGTTRGSIVLSKSGGTIAVAGDITSSATITQNIASVTGQQAALSIVATTAATSSGTQSNSPGLVFSSQHWDTVASAGQRMDWLWQSVPNAATSPIVGQLSLYQQKNGGGWNERMRVSDTGSVVAINAISAGTGGTLAVFGGSIGPNTASTQLDVGVNSNTSQVNVGRSGINVMLPGGILRASTPGAGVAGISMLFGQANGGPGSGSTPGGLGGSTTLFGGQGGAATTTAGGTAAAGGAIFVTGGKGGDGAASTNGPGAGGALNITGGAGGTQNGVGTAVGGNVVIAAGAGSGGGNNGSITIGATNTLSITLGAFGGPNINLTSNTITYGDSGSTTRTILGTPQSTANIAGGALVVAASGGGGSNGSGPGGKGGSATFRGATGGSGSGAQNPGDGGDAFFIAGGGNIGGSGNSSGGNAYLRGGGKNGTGTEGQVFIGDSGTSAVTIGALGITTTINGSLTVANTKPLSTSFNGVNSSSATFSRTSNVVTVTTSGAHGLSTGGYIQIVTGDATFYGLRGPITVTSTTAFTYAQTGADTSGGPFAIIGTGIVLSLQNGTAATSSVPQQPTPPSELLTHGWGYVAGSTSAAGSMTRSGTTVTVTTAAAHNLLTGQAVYLYPGEANFAGGSKTVTVVNSTQFTYTEAGSAVSSTGGQNWFDDTGRDQTVRVTQTLRPSLAKKFNGTGLDQGLAAPELVYHRSSYPNNGPLSEWFKISAADPFSGNLGLNSNGGLTLQTVASDGVTAGSFLAIQPGRVALQDDSKIGLYTVPSASIPSTAGFISVWGSIVFSAGSYGRTSAMGAGLGTKFAPWYDNFGVRGNYQNLGVGDVAMPGWADGGQAAASGFNWYPDAIAGATSGSLGYFQLGGQSRFQALAAPTSVTAAATGGSGTGATYLVVAVDRNGYVSTSTSVSVSGGASLSGTVYNTITWAAVPGAAYYDVYQTSVSQANWLGQVTASTQVSVALPTTTLSFKHTGAAKYTIANGAPSNNNISTPSLVSMACQAGASVPITSGFVKVASSTTVTLTFAAVHNLKVGDTIVITLLSNTTQFANGTYTVASVVSPTVITYSDAVNNASGSTQTTSGTFAVTKTYAVYAVDSDGRVIASATSTANGAYGPGLGSSSWLVIWTPVGGATRYIVCRDSLSNPIGVQAQIGVQSAAGNSKSFSKSGTSVVTVTDANGHGLMIGDTVTVTGSGNTGAMPNGTYTVTNVSSATQFQYNDSAGSFTTSTTTNYSGPAIITSNLYDFGYPARTIGSASRNNTADVAVQGDVTVNHLVGGTSTPTYAIVASSFVGTGATFSLTGTDVSGVITFTAGTSLASPGSAIEVQVGTVTFSKAYAAAPKAIIIAPADRFGANAVSGNGTVFYVSNTSITATGFTFHAETNGAGAAFTSGRAYQYYYWVI